MKTRFHDYSAEELEAQRRFEDKAKQEAFIDGVLWQGKRAPKKTEAELERHKAYLANLEDLLRKSGKREDQYKRLANDNWNRYRTLLAWLPQEMQKDVLGFMDGMVAPGGTLPEDASETTHKED